MKEKEKRMIAEKRLRRAGGVLTALLLGAVCLTGCYKGDGTEVRVRKTAKAEDNPNAELFESMATNVSVDPNAKTDTPFPFDPVAEEPVQDIILVMIYDRADSVSHTQAVNYFDRSGNVYRYWNAVDSDGDFMTPIRAHYSGGAPAVSIMGDAERETLRYLAEHVSDYSKAVMKEQDTGKDVYGYTQLWLIDKRGEPVLIARYDDVSEYRDSSEIISFLNWFRIFYHGDFIFGG